MCASFHSLKCKGVSPGDPEYETLRTRYFHARVPNTRPAKIFRPRTTLEVVDILQDARLNNSKVGIRSGGHLFPCCSLLPDGVLIDTCNLNQGINYCPHTGIVTFPPCARSKDLADALTSVGRFFPFGHSPTVAAGGFLLAGGQGWFMRGWGCTSDKWVEQMEIVTANGAIVKASKTQNVDLFWAARGSGQGFFGVVTKIWGRTIPTRRLWERVLVFDCTESFSGILHALFELTDRTPKYGVEVAFATFRPDRDDASLDEEVNDKPVFMAASTLAFADTYAEAKTMLSPWESLPNILVQHQIESIPITERSWNDLFEAQDKLNPSGNGERWQCDSILNKPEVKREQVRDEEL